MHRAQFVGAALVWCLAACGSPAPALSATPSAAPPTSGSHSAAPSPSPSAPALNVTPLIPDLAAGGALQLLTETGAVTATLPASRPLQLFSPYGDDFLVGEQSNQQLTAIGVLQPDGDVQTLATPADVSAIHGIIGSPDGHALAWLQGTPFSSLCVSGVSGGALFVQFPGESPRPIVQLPAAPAGTAWELGGYTGTTIWVLQQGGCTGTSGYTTTAYIISDVGTSLTSVQGTLGSGCTLQAVALDGSMLCVAQPQSPSGAVWKFVSASGVVHSFTYASLGSACSGYGPLHDFEGFALSADGRYISVDAGCVGASRFDELYIITTASGAVATVSSDRYCAADSFLPDDSLLCNNLSDPDHSTAYLVPAGGGVPTLLAQGQATWSGNGVTW